MRVTRSYLLLLFGLLAGGLGLAVIFEPGILPAETERVSHLLDEQIVSRFGIGLAIFVAFVAVFRLLRAKPETVDRSAIAAAPPELVTADGANNADRQARPSFERALSCFESADHAARLVAIYGRRAGSATNIDADLEAYLEDLATTAAEAYATSVGCDEETALQAVERGEWTDDRVAAAFFATDLDTQASFTVWERFNGWLAPERIFRARVHRVLDEIEAYAGTYLTYESPATGKPPAREQTESRQSRTTDSVSTHGADRARADGGETTRSEGSAEQRTGRDQYAE